MRPLETALVVGELLAFLVLVLPPLRGVRWLRLSAVGVVVVLAAAQIVLEGPRWQLVPAYLLSPLFLLVTLVQRTVAGLLLSLGALVLALAAALPILLPVFHFPAPTGPYGVGTLTYDWVDTGRPEFFTSPPGEQRELVVQVWYPTDKGEGGPRAPYLAPGTNFEATARMVHLPGFFFDHLRYVTTNAQPSAAMADGPPTFPVLIFSPGRGGYRQNNTYQVEELVSQGYVVAGMDQPYTVADVVFPDGRDVELDNRVAASVLDEHIVEDTFMLTVYDNLGQDAVFTLGQLAALNAADANHTLTGRLDLHNVGIFGASLGGIGAAEACRLEPRFRACLIVDVAMPPDVVASGLQQPTLWINADAAAKQREGWTTSAISEQETSVRAVFSSHPADGYLVSIQGMFHGDIADLPYMFAGPLGAWLGTTGPTDWRTSHAIINTYSLAFFNRYLKSEPEPSLDGAPPLYPGVSLELRQ